MGPEALRLLHDGGGRHHLVAGEDGELDEVRPQVATRRVAEGDAYPAVGLLELRRVDLLDVVERRTRAHLTVRPYR